MRQFLTGFVCGAAVCLYAEARADTYPQRIDNIFGGTDTVQIADATAYTALVEYTNAIDPRKGSRKGTVHLQSSNGVTVHITISFATFREDMVGDPRECVQVVADPPYMAAPEFQCIHDGQTAYVDVMLQGV